MRKYVLIMELTSFGWMDKSNEGTVISYGY